MKKLLLTAAVFTAGCTLFAQKITLTNSFGGNYDSIADYDLLSFNKKYDTTKNEYTNSFKKEYFKLSNRSQLDLDSKMIEGRLRATVQCPDNYGEIKGYGKFSPVSQFGIIAGNSFFSKLAVSAGYMAASDDTPNIARILQDGYGVTSEWKFGEDEKVKVLAAAGIEWGNDYSSTDELGLDCGIDIAVNNGLSFGAVGHNVTSENRRFGFFAGLNGMENTVCNIGYVYNFNDDNFLPTHTVTENDEAVVKANKTKNALIASIGYDFVDSNADIYADFVLGLDDKYIHYKDNAEEYEEAEYDGNGIPMMARLRADWDVVKSLKLTADAKVTAMLNNSSSAQIILYPNITYKLPKQLGTFSTGVRFEIDQTKDNGLSGFSIPVCWKYKISSSKK